MKNNSGYFCEWYDPSKTYTFKELLKYQLQANKLGIMKGKEAEQWSNTLDHMEKYVPGMFFGGQKLVRAVERAELKEYKAKELAARKAKAAKVAGARSAPKPGRK